MCPKRKSGPAQVQQVRAPYSGVLVPTLVPGLSRRRMTAPDDGGPSLKQGGLQIRGVTRSPSRDNSYFYLTKNFYVEQGWAVTM